MSPLRKLALKELSSVPDQHSNSNSVGALPEERRSKGHRTAQTVENIQNYMVLQYKYNMA